MHSPLSRIRAALDIPDRYGIPVVVATGYPPEDASKEEAEKKKGPQRWRYPPQEVIFDGKFGEGMAGIEPVVPRREQRR